jgi:hypothetical protein
MSAPTDSAVQPRPPSAPVKRVAAAITGVAGLVTAVLGVVFLLVPSLRPLPRDKIAASVSVADIENHVSVGRWAHLQFPGNPDGKLTHFLGHKPTPTDRATRGSIIYVRLSTDGFRHRSINLRTTLYNAQTRTPSRNTSGEAQFPDSGRLGIDAPSRSSVQLLFVADVGAVETGRFFFRVEAFDGSGILAYADSRTFDAARR